MQPLRVAVVSDDPLARGGLLALLVGQENIVVVGARPSADLEGLRALGAEAILFDGGAGSEALRPLAAMAPVVAMVAGEEQAATVFRAGARALLLRDSSGERLAAALHAAAHGLITLDRALAAWLRPVTVPPLEGLTPRELEVLSLLAEGLPNKLIAERLGTSERTAKFHVESILSKLGAENRSEAIVLAARRGLVVL